MRRTRSKLLFLASGMLALPVLVGKPSWAQSYSHARIARLSFVEGTVGVQRPDLAEWAAASGNTPIQEGFRLSSAENSFAEVEFEDASTARIGQLSLLEFTQLAVEPSGGKITRATLRRGYATFHFTPQRRGLYEVMASHATLRVPPEVPTMFRVDVEGDLVRIEVFKGFVNVSSIYGARTVRQDTALELRPGNDQPERESQGIKRDAWDEWVEQREKQTVPLESRYVPGLYSNNVTSLLYGWNDLWNYGTWCPLPGYGQVWVPNVPHGWTPYRLGRWCWYPGMGYVWISSEPWGWLPYHYGQWAYSQNAGWCWMPGKPSDWSPGLVTWFQGPGWIGWGPGSRSGADTCPSWQTCHAFVAIDKFADGEPITPGNTLAIDPSQARQVEEPGVAPGQGAMLPGPSMIRVNGVFGARIPEQPVSATSFRNQSSPVVSGGHIIVRRPAAPLAPSGAVPAVMPGIHDEALSVAAAPAASPSPGAVHGAPGSSAWGVANPSSAPAPSTSPGATPGLGSPSGIFGVAAPRPNRN